MCGERRRGSISLEKPKSGRKRREGEPCDQALAEYMFFSRETKIL
jgi:hypothetical protein